MELIVAVYDDWGIGKDGTQPVALMADRKFFRETTRGAMVIVGRRTILDFPDQKPLTRQAAEIPGFTVCNSPEEAVELAKTVERAMVIGGGSIYRQMMDYCDTAYITKVHCTPESDTYFPNLDTDPNWTMEAVLQSGEENGTAFEMCLYRKR